MLKLLQVLQQREEERNSVAGRALALVRWVSHVDVQPLALALQPAAPGSCVSSSPLQANHQNDDLLRRYLHEALNVVADEVRRAGDLGVGAIRDRVLHVRNLPNTQDASSAIVRVPRAWKAALA